MHLRIQRPSRWHKEKIKVEGSWCCRKGKEDEESRKASCTVCDEIRPTVGAPVRLPSA